MNIALTIAGSDSGGGAGLQADLKTFHQFGAFGTSVVTAVTAQNTQGVRQWKPVDHDLVAAQIAALADDLPPQAFKSGMLGSAAVARTVAAALEQQRWPNYVLDPVMVATSGDRLLDAGAEQVIATQLVPLATLVTPNTEEAAALAGFAVDSLAAMEHAAHRLLEMGAAGALITGGHLEGDSIVDVFIDRATTRAFRHRRILTRATHGTGCTLSAAIAAGLALGAPLERAVTEALDFVHRAIAAAPGLGRGHGPLNHFVEAHPR